MGTASLFRDFNAARDGGRESPHFSGALAVASGLEAAATLATQPTSRNRRREIMQPPRLKFKIRHYRSRTVRDNCPDGSGLSMRGLRRVELYYGGRISGPPAELCRRLPGLLQAERITS